ncbi:hypothetical protein ColTof3_07414 [Colletotrichum tofieldiae]|nr:hypothetical protein ColTof3_07414 [Colletotrichum tofieldiae]
MENDILRIVYQWNDLPAVEKKSVEENVANIFIIRSSTVHSGGIQKLANSNTRKRITSRLQNVTKICTFSCHYF